MPLEQDTAPAAQEDGSYEHYDPATVRPSSLDPSQSSEPPGDLAESHDEADVSITAEAFDERHREPFLGLAYLGALSKTFTYAGHEFRIRTLTTDEVLAVALITKDYEGTIGENRAYVTAVVAMAVESVDGEALPYPYKEAVGNEWAEMRFNWVKGKWFTYTVDHVYEQYLLLEGKVREVLSAMGNPQG